MITFFRRIRQKLIDSGSVTKYLLYAVGEILLVVFGILIALQINNWNEQRKLDETTRIYLKQIQLDIVDNIEISTDIIRSYQLRDSVFWVMRNRELQPSDFMGPEGHRWKRVINTWVETRLINNGYPKLLEHPGVKPGELSEILEDLKFLNLRKSSTDKIYDEIVEKRSKHLEYRRYNYAWTSYGYWNGGRVWEATDNKDEVEFYLKDIRLKNYIEEHVGLSHQLLFVMSRYIERALPTYELIQDELGEPRSEMPELIRNYYIELPEDSLQKFTGSYSAYYIPPGHSIGTFNEVDSIQIYLDPEMNPVIKGFIREEIFESSLKIRSHNKLELESVIRPQYILNADGDIEVKEIVGINYVFKRKD